ncbi:hypothetical protein ACOI1H_14785 [Loktanella sp. DJP18]|uniref:hypothetical protein n=1 Tax=Loktanella sp. DJP18 TaxID=3409788 RepID=UPI003BB67573
MSFNNTEVFDMAQFSARMRLIRYFCIALVVGIFAAAMAAQHWAPVANLLP